MTSMHIWSGRFFRPSPLTSVGSCSTHQSSTLYPCAPRKLSADLIVARFGAKWVFGICLPRPLQTERSFITRSSGAFSMSSSSSTHVGLFFFKTPMPNTWSKRITSKKRSNSSSRLASSTAQPRWPNARFGGLLERGDYETTLRWIHALGVERVGESPPLLGAKIAALRGARRLDEARALALRLHASGRLAPVVEADDAVIAHVAWSMLFQPREGLDLLDRYPTSSRALSVRYMLETTSGIDPAKPPQRVQPNETDRLMSWALMVQGRLDELVAMLPSEDQWPPRTPYTTPHPLLGLVWRGELERARALLDDVPSDVKQRIEYDVWNYLEAWLLLAEGDAEGALVAAEFAVAHSRITGFGFEPVFQIVQGEALLSLDRVEEAVTVLSETIERNRGSGLLAYTEWGLTYLGRARLLENRNQEAVELLREAVEGMTRAQRLLLLPAAAIYLAEAERRLGNEACSDSAAAIAYSTSLTMGAFTPLRRALTQFPEVAHWVLERDSTTTIEWRRLLRSSDSTAARTPAVARSGAVFDIQPFGISPDIIVDGDAANVRRLKVIELACFLSAHPKGVTREEAQIHLFPESDRQRGSNYFRQVVHQLRKSTGLTLQRLPGSRIAFPDDVRVDAADIRFERVLAEASSAWRTRASSASSRGLGTARGTVSLRK